MQLHINMATQTWVHASLISNQILTSANIDADDVLYYAHVPITYQADPVAFCGWEVFKEVIGDRVGIAWGIKRKVILVQKYIYPCVGRRMNALDICRKLGEIEGVKWACGRGLADEAHSVPHINNPNAR